MVVYLQKRCRVFSFHSYLRGGNRKWKESAAFCVQQRCLGAPRALVTRQELELGPHVFINNRRPANTAMEIALCGRSRWKGGRVEQRYESDEDWQPDSGEVGQIAFRLPRCFWCCVHALKHVLRARGSYQEGSKYFQLEVDLKCYCTDMTTFFFKIFITFILLASYFCVEVQPIESPVR